MSTKVLDPAKVAAKINQDRFIARHAVSGDQHALTRLWFRSFLPSHKFWWSSFPDDDGKVVDKWFTESWRISIEVDPIVEQIVIIDKTAEGDRRDTHDGRMVAFGQWSKPNVNGGKNEHKQWPDIGGEKIWDWEILGPFLGGMDENKNELMQDRPHYHLEFLGTDPDYQKQGFGLALVEIGCEKADAEGLEAYVDASMDGLPFYIKHFGFKRAKIVDLPVRPETYGQFDYWSCVRPKRGDQ